MAGIEPFDFLLGVELDLWGYDIYLGAYFAIEIKLQSPFGESHYLN